MHIKAIEAHIKKNGSLPVNIKFFIEGEEEVGSVHLDEFVRSHKQELAADVVVISDSPMFDRGIPSICYGLRGLAYFQIDCAARRATCTRDRSAARWPTRRSCSARSWRR
jgi:acetylornithine deacetylase/succinyl-diaminopimelate desuccinylase-like protein